MATQRELTHKEIMMINDLLDGQLSPEKAKQAFLAIERDQALNIAYEKLRWTKSLLRQAPRRKVPHNFTLTRQMAKEATGFYRLRKQTFSIAGALASFLFVVLLAVQIFPMGFKSAMPAMDMANEVSLMEEAAPVMMQAVEEEPMEEVETFALDAEIAEEELAGDNPAESIETSPLEEDTKPVPTISPDEAAGGGALQEEEANVRQSDSPETLSELSEDEMDRMTEQASEEAMSGVAADEEMLEAMPLDADIMAKEYIPEDSPVFDQFAQKQPKDWLFLATVLTGLLAFVFIFIAIRDRRNE